MSRLLLLKAGLTADITFNCCNRVITMVSKAFKLAGITKSISSDGIIVEDAAPNLLTTYTSINLLPLSGNQAGDMAFIDSSNKLYIYTGDGWYSLALINEVPIITVDVDNNTIIDALAGDPLIVTATSSDPEGFALTYSYELISGTLGGTTITQSNNVFTITPSADSQDLGDITIRFTVSDGLNTNSIDRTFAVTFLPTLTEFMDTRSPLHLIQPSGYTSGTQYTDYYNGTWGASSGGTVSTVTTPAGFPTGDYINLEGDYMELSSGSQTIGQYYTHFYTWRPRISDSSWRTGFRGDNDHIMIVQENTKNLGMYSNRFDAFNDTGYDITTDWQTLIIVGVGSTSTSNTGTQTFYVNGVNVGTTIRVGSGTNTYRLGYPGQAPGHINTAGILNQALTSQEIATLHDVLVARMTPQ
jgi:hypothetical protein